MISANGTQLEAFPYNEPATMPIEPVARAKGGWLRIPIEFPGRTVQLRVWQASVGRLKLYLLDSNDQLNSPVDRGITGKLYGGGTEIRFMQEVMLGIGGWRVVEALHPEIEICHINEGHAAFAVLERASQIARRHGLSFREGLWAARAGNVFTTHTPMQAGFDCFDSELIERYLPAAQPFLTAGNGKLDEVLALGRANAADAREPFNMAFLATRGSLLSFGVSRLHGSFSRRIFQPLFPRWPQSDIPVDYVTNGVHIPSWDSAEADRIWTEACGKERWRQLPDELHEQVTGVSDEELWALRGKGRLNVVRHARRHLVTQLRERGFGPQIVQQAQAVLDPNVLTLGFARRFTAYKRPNLLLRDRVRLARLLTDERRPVQIIVAGKAHPADVTGKRMIREWIELARRPALRRHIVFLEDYDISLAQELVQGVDVWINNPRRPWEACGTSGMKVLVNGGLNCSVRDGWWDEAWSPDVGWAIGDLNENHEHSFDESDAESLYDVLENAVVPEFYDRDKDGMPRRWLARIRESMARLTPIYSSTRMVHEYVDKAYLPAAEALRRRLADECHEAKTLAEWAAHVRQRWSGLHVDAPAIARGEGVWNFSVPVFLGELRSEDVLIQLYANPGAEGPGGATTLRQGRAIPGAVNGFIYVGQVPATRPASDFTVRAIPQREGTAIPTELPLVLWQR